MNKTLALCMIVKNEEDTLPNCLSSVDNIFDEIIIVDTGSVDDTIDIARKYTDKIYHFEWIEDFSAARNFAFSKSVSDYIMWLDADDILLPNDAEKLKNLKSSLDGRVEEYVALYNVGFDENGEVNFNYYRERIFLRAAELRWSGNVHETIPLINGRVYVDFAVTHHKVHPTESGRNLRIYEKMKADGAEFDARNSYYYARELYYNDKIDNALVEFSKCLNLPGNTVENYINACSLLAACINAKGGNPLGALFKSFEYDVPRAEICCDIGKYFFENRRYAESIYWYEDALRKTPDTESGGFVSLDCYEYIPCIQLCVLYYNIGDIERAISYNNRALLIKPKDNAALFNKNFFENFKK